jgi:hypothetical protein
VVDLEADRVVAVADLVAASDREALAAAVDDLRAEWPTRLLRANTT